MVCTMIAWHCGLSGGLCTMNVKNVQLMLRPAACCPTLLCTHQTMARCLIVSMHKDCMLVNLTLIFKGQAELLIVKVQVESAFGAIQPKLFLWASANACATRSTACAKPYLSSQLLPAGVCALVHTMPHCGGILLPAKLMWGLTRLASN